MLSFTIVNSGRLYIVLGRISSSHNHWKLVQTAQIKFPYLSCCSLVSFLFILGPLEVIWIECIRMIPKRLPAKVRKLCLCRLHQFTTIWRTRCLFSTKQARSQPVFSGKPGFTFCLSCTFIFRNERNWMKKSARVSEKLVSLGLPDLLVATRLQSLIKSTRSTASLCWT